MSMDDQFVQMKAFHQALINFNEQLRASVSELEAQHEHVSPLWQDEMRREYDQVWSPFKETMRHYIAREGPSYVEFLSIKIHALGRYLHGG